jgi:hypothetical protein
MYLEQRGSIFAAKDEKSSLHCQFLSRKSDDERRARDAQ